MQRIIQINIAGRVIPIEEDAYTLLRNYLTSLERQFGNEEGKEIVEDIENRIAELFTIRLDGGAPAIDRADVTKVMETLGNAGDLGDGNASKTRQGSRQYTYTSDSASGSSRTYAYSRERVLRDPYDKMIGGVCSGIAHYFDVDPVIVRLVMVVLFLTMGIGLVAYIIAWAVIPAAKSREELYNMNNGNPMTFHDITRNVGAELKDLQKRGEQMSRELQDFFRKQR